MANSVKKSLKRPILYIIEPAIDITGAFNSAYNEAKLLQNDFDIVIVLSSNTQIKKESLLGFKSVKYLPIVNIQKSFKSIMTYLPILVYSGWKLKQYMELDNCKNLQVNDYYLMQGVMARLFGYKGKIVTWVRIEPGRYGSFFSTYWLKYAYWASNNIVAVSEFIFNKLPLSEKNRLLYDPVMDTSKLVSSNKDTDVRKIIYIGNYIEGKGQQYAIQAFQKIASDFSDVELNFYGGDMGLKKNRQYKKNLQLLAKNLKLENQIIFHDFIKDTRKVLQEGYMSLNFSESESFSMTCLEASAAGLSVVATKSGGPEEIIVDGETGYLVEKGDIDAMAKAIRKLLVNAEKNREFGENGAKYVRKTFSPEKFQKDIQNIFLGDIK